MAQGSLGLLQERLGCCGFTRKCWWSWNHGYCRKSRFSVVECLIHDVALFVAPFCLVSFSAGITVSSCSKSVNSVVLCPSVGLFDTPSAGFLNYARCKASTLKLERGTCQSKRMPDASKRCRTQRKGYWSVRVLSWAHSRYRLNNSTAWELCKTLFMCGVVGALASLSDLGQCSTKVYDPFGGFEAEHCQSGDHTRLCLSSRRLDVVEHTTMWKQSAFLVVSVGRTNCLQWVSRRKPILVRGVKT